MTDKLGYLLWWKVGEVNLTHDQLETALAGTGLTLPARPIPHDVFRRVTGSPPQITGYALDDHRLEFSLANVTTPSDKMLVKHIVGTLYDDKDMAITVLKAGDMAFYYPPRGKNSKARMRVTVSPPREEWRAPVEDYARQLRTAYDEGVRGALDGQAIRRLIRAHLTNVRALYLDGPYFVRDVGAAELPLRPLFEALGPDSFMHLVPLPDLDRHRAFLVRGLERAIKTGVEVDEEIWKLAEGGEE